MREQALRKFHRTWGIILTNLVALHLLTCLLLATEKTWSGPAQSAGVMAAVAFVLNHWPSLASWWRLVLSLGAAVQTLTGIMLFSVTLARSRPSPEEWDGPVQPTAGPMPQPLSGSRGLTPF
jgi:hypothetical protein